MSEENFPVAMEFIWNPQRDGHQQDSARGENFRTSWGVIQSTWDHAVHDGIVKGDLAKATKPQCMAIYRCYFWNMMGGDLLPHGLDIQLFEQGTLSGAGRAAGILQRNVGFRGRDIDGVIGPKTRGAVMEYDVHELIHKQHASFMAFLRTLGPKWTLNRGGWTTRENASRDLAHELAEAAGHAYDRSASLRGDIE